MLTGRNADWGNADRKNDDWENADWRIAKWENADWESADRGKCRQNNPRTLGRRSRPGPLVQLKYLCCDATEGEQQLMKVNNNQSFS